MTKLKWMAMAGLLALGGVFAGAAPAAAGGQGAGHGGGQGGGAAVTPPKHSQCLDDCIDRFERNMRRCRRGCWVCEFSVLGVCFSGYYLEECLQYCTDAANNAHEACVAECPSA